MDTQHELLKLKFVKEVLLALKLLCHMLVMVMLLKNLLH